MGEHEVEKGPDDRDGDEEEEPGRLVLLLGRGVDDENPDAEVGKEKGNDDVEGRVPVQGTGREEIDDGDDEGELEEDADHRHRFLPEAVPPEFHSDPIVADFRRFESRRRKQKED